MVNLQKTYIALGTFITALAEYVITAQIHHKSAYHTEQLNILSTTDLMTGLCNKAAFENHCKAYFSQDLSTRNYAMLFMDVDRFKQINDKYGHPFGDEVLKNIAAVIREIFNSSVYSCRYGGDEFVILMMDITDENYVKDRVAHFQQSVTLLVSKLGIDTLSCSVGIAVKADEKQRYSEMLSRADSALYIAKERHSGCVMIDRNGQAVSNQTDMQHAVTDTGKSRKPDVLVIDDSAVNREILKNILTDKYNVLEAENGREALLVLTDNYKTVSAVLLDIIMPVMDGYDFLSSKNREQKIADIPVIVTTVSNDEESERKALSLGANDFLMKPYRHAIVLKRLENTIRLYRRR